MLDRISVRSTVNPMLSAFTTTQQTVLEGSPPQWTQPTHPYPQPATALLRVEFHGQAQSRGWDSIARPNPTQSQPCTATGSCVASLGRVAHQPNVRLSSELESTAALWQCR